MRNKRILSFLVALISLLTLLPAASAANDVYVGQTFCFGSYEQDGNLRNGDEPDRKSTRLNSSHPTTSRMPSSA